MMVAETSLFGIRYWGRKRPRSGSGWQSTDGSGASTADEAVAEGASMADEVVAEDTSQAGEAAAEDASTADDA